MKIKIGIDEAGRGCVLGPLCVGAVSFCSENDDEYFKEIGVKDSKKLSKEKRELLFDLIKDKCYCKYKKIYPSEIDNNNLNKLEFDTMLSLINEIIVQYTFAFSLDIEFDVYIDCPESDSYNHAKSVKDCLYHSSGVNIISEHKADDKFVVVGASSIIAKVTRDKDMEMINNNYNSLYGDIGSGYPSDPKTNNFLKLYYKKNKNFPIETRMKWGTIDKIRREFCEDTEFNWKKSWSNI